MSYILDALRRADAERERERGGVPGLHTQALPAPGPEPASSRALPGWAWAALGLGAGLLVALGAWLALRTPPGATPTPVPRAAVPASAPPVVAAAAPPVASPPVASPPVATPAALPPRATPVETPPPPRRAVAASQPVAPAASASAAPVLPFERLPEDVRRQLPRLAVDGSVYSEQHAQRILIIGGQLFHEGDAVAPGVVLDRIDPRSAVLRWHDWRYSIAY
jgi:general secretion pathway protein B